MLEIETDVVGCGRCGGLHNDVKFYPFTRPPSSSATHFGLCPELNEPILAYTVESRWEKLRAILRGHMLVRQTQTGRK